MTWRLVLKLQDSIARQGRAPMGSKSVGIFGRAVAPDLNITNCEPQGRTDHGQMQRVEERKRDQGRGVVGTRRLWTS